MEALGFPCCAAPLQTQPPCITMETHSSFAANPQHKATFGAFCMPNPQHKATFGAFCVPNPQHKATFGAFCTPLSGTSLHCSLHADNMAGKEMGSAQCSLKQSYGYFGNNQRPINSSEALQQASCN